MKKVLKPQVLFLEVNDIDPYEEDREAINTISEEFIVETKQINM